MATDAPPSPPAANAVPHHFRFLDRHGHLASAFGPGWFGAKAENFARFFGTPTFLIAQTCVVAVWIAFNVVGLAHFDLYPFILLNLAFSLQSAYAAPLILLAQTRQADRDKALAEADAMHREELAKAAIQRQEFANEQNEKMMVLLQQNTELTEVTQELSRRIADLTDEIHRRMCGPAA